MIFRYFALLILLTGSIYACSRKGSKRERISEIDVAGRDTEEFALSETAAIVKQFPNILEIEDKDRDYQCAATAISDSKAITTASCVYKFLKNHDGLIIRGKSHRKGTGEELYTVKQIVIPPNFKPTEKGKENLPVSEDIAIITIKERFQNINSISFATKDPDVGSKGVSLGYEETHFRNSGPLREREVTIESRNDCDEAEYFTKYNYRLGKDMLCGEFFDNVYTMGNGGPLIVKGELAGIVLTDVNHRTGLRYSVFTSIVSYKGFINSELKH